MCHNRTMKRIFIFALIFLLSACAAPITSASPIVEVTVTFNMTVTSTPSPFPAPTEGAGKVEAADIGTIFTQEMKGKAPTVADASMGNYEIVQSESGVYRAVNEKLGVNVELHLVKDQYGERLVGGDGRCIFLKDPEDEWIVPPFFRWGAGRIELGIVENSTYSGNGITDVTVAGELVGYEEPVEVEYEGQKHSLPVAVFWVGNDQKGEKILFRTVLGFLDGIVLENAYGGSSLSYDPEALSSLTPLSSNGVSPEALVSDLVVGGTYAISLVVDGEEMMKEYVVVNANMVDYLSGEDNALENAGLGMTLTVYVPMARH